MQRFGGWHPTRYILLLGLHQPSEWRYLFHWRLGNCLLVDNVTWELIPLVAYLESIRHLGNKSRTAGFSELKAI